MPIITMTKVGADEGGQSNRIMTVSGVLPGDLIFGTCSYYAGGSPFFTLSGITTVEIGSSQIRANAGSYAGDVIAVVAEALTAGTLRVDIGSTSMGNLDACVVVFRPSSSTENVNAYIRTVIANIETYTDPLDVYLGEWILCAQYSSGGTSVPSSPVGTDKVTTGAAAATVRDWRLPEGATSGGNSFMELIEITGGDGTFKYLGPNPTVIRVTVQGDPDLSDKTFEHTEMI